MKNIYFLLISLLLVGVLVGRAGAEESKMKPEDNFYVHKVKSYAGDGYWREFIRSHKDGAEEFKHRYGEDRLKILLSGQRTEKDIIESANKKGDYFYDKDGVEWRAQ